MVGILILKILDLESATATNCSAAQLQGPGKGSQRYQRRLQVPLSDREQKLLDELEFDLATKDPRLARVLSSGSAGDRFSAHTYFAALACLIGLVLLIAGIASQVIAVGVIGFLLMGAGTYVLVDDRPEQQPPIDRRPVVGPGKH
jgi:Flp pilus assembly protein TadB